jgi:hypothetical protein
MEKFKPLFFMLVIKWSDFAGEFVESVAITRKLK